jgi:hypothetical protein
VSDAVTRVVSMGDAASALRMWDSEPAAVTRIHVDLD